MPVRERVRLAIGKVEISKRSIEILETLDPEPDRDPGLQIPVGVMQDAGRWIDRLDALADLPLIVRREAWLQLGCVRTV